MITYTTENRIPSLIAGPTSYYRFKVDEYNTTSYNYVDIPFGSISGDGSSVMFPDGNFNGGNEICILNKSSVIPIEVATTLDNIKINDHPFRKTRLDFLSLSNSILTKER